MSEESKVEFYGIGDPEDLTHEDRDECIEAYLDSTHPEPFPDTVTVVSYRRMIGVAIGHMGGWDGRGLDPSASTRTTGARTHEQTPAAMDAISFACAGVPLTRWCGIRPWACESCGEEAVDAKAWVAGEPAGVVGRFGAGELL